MEDKKQLPRQIKVQIWKRWHQIMQHKNCTAAHISYIHYGTETDRYTAPFKPIKIFPSLRFVNVT